MIGKAHLRGFRARTFATSRDHSAMPTRWTGGSPDLWRDVAKIDDGKPAGGRVIKQMGQRSGPTKEKMMSAPLKSTVAILALLGTIFASAAQAERGPGGPDSRGKMLLEMFDSIDTDGDGKLTEAELAAHREALFTASDTNGDGMLDAKELAARQLARFNETLSDRTARMIENRDNNGDGSLSLAEVDEGPGQRHFARIDSDNDGAISKAEAEAAMDRMGKGKHRKGMMQGGANN
ncbi:MAG: hypothetical protein C0524_08330 [Rhodobacter sp.]|nr:hypothetical protein [Rhodobacter sp.]